MNSYNYCVESKLTYSSYSDCSSFFKLHMQITVVSPSFSIQELSYPYKKSFFLLLNK